MNGPRFLGGGRGLFVFWLLRRTGSQRLVLVGQEPTLAPVPTPHDLPRSSKSFRIKLLMSTPGSTDEFIEEEIALGGVSEDEEFALPELPEEEEIALGGLDDGEDLPNGDDFGGIELIAGELPDHEDLPPSPRTDNATVEADFFRRG